MLEDEKNQGNEGKRNIMVLEMNNENITDRTEHKRIKKYLSGRWRKNGTINDLTELSGKTHCICRSQTEELNERRSHGSNQPITALTALCDCDELHLW